MNIQDRRRGRPGVRVASPEVASLRGQGLSWREIARELGIGKDMARNGMSRTESALILRENPLTVEIFLTQIFQQSHGAV
jgi:DNA-binding CsgD family transcriptional regulator